MFTDSLLALWPLAVLVLVLGGLGLIASLLRNRGQEDSAPEDFPYEKKPFVFDAMTELTLYRALLELYGGKYYVFPEIGYSKLVQVKKGTEKKYRNRFDKKSADFVLCDKERAVARLVIELDGSSHNSETRIERDAQVDKMMLSIGLPILHLKTSAMDKESVRSQIDAVLSK